MYTTYVARQPIFNVHRQTLGYELLFRDGERNAYPEHIDSDRATYRLIAENLLSLGTNVLIDRSRCFINFPQKSLLRRLPLALPKNKVVVEILETCEPNDELLAAVQELYEKGYRLALDDFVYAPEWERFLPYIHIIKLDIMALGIEQACQLVKERGGLNARHRFLAERVENLDQFNQTRSAGFTFFQGYFFSKPIISQRRYLSPNQILAMQLFQEVCRTEVDFNRVEQIIEQDITLSYTLLKCVNGVSDRLAAPMKSFRQALIYLGEDRLKIFVSLAVASYISTRKPKELYLLSLQRAQFCQRMSRYRPFQQQRDQAFLIGLFSLLDALLDASLDELLEQLPLSKDIKLALSHRAGPYGQLLELKEQFEQANWDVASDLCQQLGLRLAEVNQELTAALHWSQKIQHHL